MILNREALKALVADLKTFTGKNENAAELSQGCGERVCYIINDLLNRELIKQNFRFKPPVVPDDDELEESKYDPNEKSKIDPRVVDSSSQPLSGYFKDLDLNTNEGALIENENEEAAFDEEEREMIFPVVDANEWYREHARVCDYIDKNLDIEGNVVESRKSVTKPRNLFETTAIDELLEKITKISAYYTVVKDFVLGGGK